MVLASQLAPLLEQIQARWLAVVALFLVVVAAMAAAEVATMVVATNWFVACG